MSKSTWIVTFFAFVTGISQAHAYDEDTHFYGTYAMARYAGLRDDVAEKVALTAAWMDQSFLSDPESLIMLPADGVKKRRLLHFPSSMKLTSMTEDTESRVLGMSLDRIERKVQDVLGALLHREVDLSGLSMFSKTEEGNLWSTELLMRGLKAGNLMMAATSLHTLEDSFAHAGFPAEEGHFYVWHWPDRPFEDVEKYDRMVHSVFQALVALRSQLPADALDKSNLNYQQSAEMLADAYFEIVKPVISIDILKDPQYVHQVLQDFYQRAQAAGYIDPLLNAATAENKIQEVQSANQGIDAYAAGRKFLGAIMNKTPQEPAYVNWPVLLASLGADIDWDPSDSSKNFKTLVAVIAKAGPDMDPHGNVVDVNSKSFKAFSKRLIDQMFEYQIPHHHKTDEREMEDDTSNIRALEMSLRDANMQKFIANTFHGKKIAFVFNATSDANGFGREIAQDPTATTPVGSDPGVDYATFSVPEKYQFDVEIFHYLFPSLKVADLRTFVDWAKRVQAVKVVRDQYVKDLKAAKKVSMIKAKVPASLMARFRNMFHRGEEVLDDVAKVELKYAGKGVNTVEYPLTLARFGEQAKELGNRNEIQTFIDDLVKNLTPTSGNDTYINPMSLQDWTAANQPPQFLGSKDAWADSGSSLLVNDPNAATASTPQ